MEFHKVVEVVYDSIQEFEGWAQKHSSLVLSEADFERNLSNVISENLSSSNNDEDKYVVHNQISHYPGDDSQYICKRDAQVDILIMKDSDIKKESTISKGFVYSGNAVALELKYYRKGQPVSSIIHDLEKSEYLLTDNGSIKTAFFVVALLEEKDDEQTKKIEEYFVPYKKKERQNMYTFLLSKDN